MRSIREEIVMEFVVLTKVVLTKEECASFFNSFHLQNFDSLWNRWLNKQKITDYNHAYRLVFEFLEGFYNTVRIYLHSTITRLINLNKTI